MFNANEILHELGRVLAEKISKSVYLAGDNDDQENITVILTANVAGQIVPPMIVFGTREYQYSHRITF